MKKFRMTLCIGLMATFFVQTSVAVAQDALVGLARGTEVIFEDNLTSEKIGEFPSSWELVKGSAKTDLYEGQYVLSFLGTQTVVRPHMESGAYLPEAFILELDYLMNHFTQHSYEIQFLDSHGRRSASLRITGRDYSLSAARGGKISEGSTPETSNSFTPGWKQLALSVHEGVMRAFCSGASILNVPRLQLEMKGLQIVGGRPANARPNQNAFIKNVMITAGGRPLYDQLMTEGKFVTTEIRFEVNKANVTPESMSVIQQVYKMMQDHQALRFSVEGHTDSDGDAEWNKGLSQQRAESVVHELVQMGIAADRLTARGWGDTRPVADNATAEGKEQNRRVEFLRK